MENVNVTGGNPLSKEMPSENSLNTIKIAKLGLN